jgi:CRP/FNR family transcriptional regulator
MYPKQADLFWGLNQNFIQTVTAIASKESFQQGDYLFHAGSQATHFYVLISGSIKLIIGESEQVVFQSDRVGEIFGWSALLNREEYSATGFCQQPSVLLMYDQEHFNRILEKDPESAFLFYRQLSRSLGDRLLETYRKIEPSSSA